MRRTFDAQVCKNCGEPIHKTLFDKTEGPTAWARKAIAEAEKGKRVVLVYPIDKWILMLLEAGAKVSNLGDVKWLATEDGTPGKGTGRHIACFVLEGDDAYLRNNGPERNGG